MKKLLLPLAVLLVALFLSIIIFFTITEKHQNWQTTTGTITSIEITDRTRGAGEYIHYHWTYIIDDVSYSGYDVFHYSGSLNIKQGDEKEIWYNPANPSESQFSKPSPSLSVYIPFLFAIPIMLAFYHLQAKKEHNALGW